MKTQEDGLKASYFVGKLFLLVLLIMSSCNNQSESVKMEKKTYSQSDILEHLDSMSLKKDCFFPDFENMHYDYLGGSKMHLYADNKRWAIVFEYIIFNNNETSVEVIVDYFGNCLKNLDTNLFDNELSISNTKRVILSDEDDVNPICEDFPYISKKAASIKIRDENVKIEHDLNKYKQIGINTYSSDNTNNSINIISFLRYAVQNQPSLFNCTEQELRLCIPEDLTELMVLKEWYHQPYWINSDSTIHGKAPSSYETFNLIADVLVNQDTTLYKPTLKPNTHWSNW